MRRAIATLGAFVLVGTFSVSAGAGPAGPVEVQAVQEKRACQELPELRQELLRLHQELRRLEAALADAKASGNRERVKQIMQEIRIVKEQISEVQHKIRRLLEVCG